MVGYSEFGPTVKIGMSTLLAAAARDGFISGASSRLFSAGRRGDCFRLAKRNGKARGQSDIHASEDFASALAYPLQIGKATSLVIGWEPRSTLTVLFYDVLGSSPSLM
jgi:hypothetical protein